MNYLQNVWQSLQNWNFYQPSYLQENNNSKIFHKLFSSFHLKAEEAIDFDKKDERPSKILVGGGTGFIGQEVCRLLRKSGYEVVIISRHSGQYRMTYGNLQENGLPSGTKAVINLAGQNVLDPLRRWSPEFKELCRSSRIETTKRLATAIRETSNKPSVFVTVTGVGYYASDSNLHCDETSGRGQGWLAELAEQWEHEASQSGVRTVILRPGVVLGRNGGMISQIYLPFFLGLGGRMGEGGQPMPWVHVKDVSGMIKHAIEDESMEGVYNAVAPHMVTNQQFVDAFAGALQRPAFFPLPDFVWNSVFGEERASMITKGQWIEPKRSLESGYKFRFPTIQEAAAEFSKFPYMDIE